MRLFIALMTTPIQEQIFEIEEGLKKQIADVRWVKKDNLHLTLKFLGDVDKVKFGLIKEIIVDIGSQCKEFDFSFSRVSGFPKEEAARVIFIGLDKGVKEIKEIMIKLDEETFKMGFKREKSYVPHLTVGRVKFGTVNLKISRKNNFPVVMGYATGIEIIKSELTKFGPIYTSIYKFDFR